MASPQQNRDEDVVRLLAHLFHKVYCPEEGIRQDQKGLVMPVHFCGWIDQKMALLDPYEVCEKANVGYEIWQFVRQILDSGAAPERFYQVWFSVVLGDRPIPRNALSQMTLLMLLSWEDGTILPVQVFVTPVMLETGQVMTDGILASMLAKNTGAFTNAIVEDGIDGLHDKGKNYRGSAPEDPFEVVMGLMLQHLIPKVRPELRAECEGYMRLFQGIVRPKIPPEILQQIEERKRAWANQGRAHGGWDT